MYKRLQNKYIDLDDLASFLKFLNLIPNNDQQKEKTNKDQANWLSMSTSGTNNVMFKYN